MKGFIAYFLVAGFLLQGCKKIDPQEEKFLFDSFAEHLKKSRVGEPETAIQIDITRGLNVDFKEHCEKAIPILLEPELAALDEKAEKDTNKGRADLWYKDLFFEIKHVEPNDAFSNSDIKSRENIIKDIIRCALCSNSKKLRAAYFMGMVNKKMFLPMPGGKSCTPIEWKLFLPIIEGNSMSYNECSNYRTDGGMSNKTSAKKMFEGSNFEEILCECRYRKELNKDLELLLWRIKGNFKQPVQNQVNRAIQISNSAIAPNTWISLLNNSSTNQPSILSSQFDNQQPIQKKRMLPESNQQATQPSNIASYPQNIYNNVPQTGQIPYSQYGETQSLTNRSIIPDKIAPLPTYNYSTNSNNVTSQLPKTSGRGNILIKASAKPPMNNNSSLFLKSETPPFLNSNYLSANQQGRNQLKDEYKSIQEDIKSSGIPCELTLVNMNLYEWEGVIEGPKNTLYEGTKYHIYIKIPQEYPAKPPHVWFQTPISHPNLMQGCLVGLSYLEESNWDPNKKIIKIIKSLFDLLNGKVDKDAIINPEAEELFDLSNSNTNNNNQH